MSKLTKHPRYQDYVIRDGKLVGEFEEMYRDFDDPWEQSAHEPHALDKTIGLALLKKYGHQRALEYGCGLGHFTAQLNGELGAAAGIDISHTAIRKARVGYPDATFFVGDVTGDTPISIFKPDVLVFAEITWYVLESLIAFKKLMLAQCPGRGFLHILTVYPEGQQRYGKDYFTNLEEILTYWSDVITVKEWGWVSNNEFNGVARTFLYGTIKHG
jgi:SAM-dependent methyltransferase